MRNTITNSTRIITKRSCNSVATDTNERYKWLWWLRFPETTRWRATDGIFDAFFNESPTTDEKSPLCLFPFSRRSVVSLIDRKRSQVFRLFFASFFFQKMDYVVFVRVTYDTRSKKNGGDDPCSTHFTTYLCICPTDRLFPEARKRAKHRRLTIFVRHPGADSDARRRSWGVLS